MTSTMTSVVCAECRHENETERIYCHNCGARLDRSAVKPNKPDSSEARKQVKKFFNPRRDRLRALFFKISKLVLGACAVAALVQIALPPDLPPAPKTAMLASQVGLELEHAVTRHQPARLEYSDDQVNSFLVYALKPKKASLDKPLLDFKRAVVAFREGACSVTMERALFGYSLYTTAVFTPKVGGGKIVVENRGGSIGRLQVHPQIARFMGLLFGDLQSALARDTKLVAKMGAIEVHDKTAVLTAP